MRSFAKGTDIAAQTEYNFRARRNREDVAAGTEKDRVVIRLALIHDLDGFRVPGVVSRTDQ